MQAYLDILKNVLYQGLPKQPVRFDNVMGVTSPIPVEQNTIGLPLMIFEHDMHTGFPLLTTKKVAWKAICVELEGFIKGITSKQWYKDRGCNIWDYWCNPTQIPNEVQVKGKTAVLEYMMNCDDLGPIYGSQWRNFANSGYDQLATIAERLKQNPYDRRMVCSAWAPQDIAYMALPPCHFCWNVVVYGDTISLWWGQRSCDLMLGVPFNIASYALLLQLLAWHSGLLAWKLTGVLADCHIYNNQIEAAVEQSKRVPKQLSAIKLIHADSEFDIRNWDHTMVALLDYNPDSKINFGKVMVT